MLKPNTRWNVVIDGDRMKPSQTAADDLTLFRRARRDPDAFAELYRAYAPAVYGWFRAHAGADPDTAADLTAEVFARALVGIRRFKGSYPGAGTAWLFRIVRNLAIDFARSRAVESRARKRLGLAESYESSQADDVALRLDAQRSVIMRVFEQLSVAEQRAIRGRVIEGRPYSEVAAASGSSELAARLQVMRGLRRLREMISTSLGGDLT